jgi:outer membrane lipoprotein carrier protein
LRARTLPWKALALAAVLASPGVPVRAELGAVAVVEGLQRWLDGTRDLEGRFRQTLSSGALGTGLDESGRMWLRRPGRMRWDYLDPERKVALVDGRATRLYLEEDAQLWEGRLEDSGLLALLLAGSERVATLFVAELEGAPGAEGAYRLRLVPRAEEGSFESVVLVLRPPEFGVERAEVQDAAGNRMLYEFSELRRNHGIPESVFGFEPPPGTQVVRP